MKFLMFPGLFTLLLLSCNKSSSNSKELTGTWELTEVHGRVVTDTLPDAWKETLTLNTDTYELRTSIGITTGTYSTHTDSTVQNEVCLVIEPGVYTHRIDFSERTNDKKIFYELSGSTLKLISGCFAYDGGSEKIYKRKALH